MAKLYTGKGDNGTTGLIGEGRVSKADLRLEAIGSLDELNSFIGNAKCLCKDEFVYTMLETIQRDLYSIMAELANISGAEIKKAVFDEQRVMYLEKMLEDLGSGVEMPSSFILPGETQQAATFGLCRSVTRRAERRVVDLNEQTELGNPQILRYLNRLSSLFFLLEVKLSTQDGLKNFKYAKVS